MNRSYLLLLLFGTSPLFICTADKLKTTDDTSKELEDRIGPIIPHIGPGDTLLLYLPKHGIYIDPFPSEENLRPQGVNTAREMVGWNTLATHTTSESTEKKSKL